MAVQVSALKGLPSPPLPEMCRKGNVPFGLFVLLSICFQSLSLRGLFSWLGKFYSLKDVRWWLGQHVLGRSGTDAEKMGQQQDWCMASAGR